MQNIEGLPLGTRWDYMVAEIEPDNVYGVLDLETVKIPEGYKRAEQDWFREPTRAEFCAYLYIAVTSLSSGYDKRRIILEPIKRTRQVLVLEYVVSGDVPCIAKHTISESTADCHLNSGHALNARIEERPI